jgi:hypothetical protein
MLYNEKSTVLRRWARLNSEISLGIIVGLCLRTSVLKFLIQGNIIGGALEIYEN